MRFRTRVLPTTTKCVSTLRTVRTYTHTRIRFVRVSRRGDDWKKEREREKETAGNKKAARDSHRATHTIERKEHVTHRVLAFKRGRMTVFVRSVRELCVDRARGA